MGLKAEILAKFDAGSEVTTHDVQRRWPQHTNQTVSSILCALVREGLFDKRKIDSPDYQGRKGQSRQCNLYRRIA